MGRGMRRFVILVVLVAAFAVAERSALSAQPATPRGTADGQVEGARPALVPAPNILSGEIRRVGEALTIVSEETVQERAVAQNVTVLRDGRRAELTDLRPGDRALVVLGEDRRVQRIEALSGREGSSRTAAWLVPLLLGLGLAGALWWLLAGPRAPFILQRSPARTRARLEGRR